MGQLWSIGLNVHKTHHLAPMLHCASKHATEDDQRAK